MTSIVGNQQVGIRPGVGTNGVAGPRPRIPEGAKRSDYLKEDTVDISTKKKEKDKEDKGVVKVACDAIGSGVKSFVNITVNAFAKAASEAVIGKIMK